jgi:hypothetical protein
VSSEFERSVRKLDDLDGITLTASDAFLAMGAFVRDFAGRVEPEYALVTLWAGIEVDADGITGDPASLGEWLKCLREVSEGRTDERP